MGVREMQDVDAATMIVVVRKWTRETYVEAGVENDFDEAAHLHSYEEYLAHH
jgi:hypothetical protein